MAFRIQVGESVLSQLHPTATRFFCVQLHRFLPTTTIATGMSSSLPNGFT